MTMPDNISIAVVGSALTYFAQVAIAYLLVRILCRLIPSARTRMWLWSGFLLGAFLGWLAFLARSLGGIAANSVVPHRPTSALHWYYRLERIPAIDLNLWEKWGLRFYLSVAMVSLLVWGYRRFQLRALLRLGQQPSSEICLLFRRLTRKINVRCRIILIPQLRSPSMAGWIRPYVLLPRDLLADLKRSDLIDVLLHELIHVRRRDYLLDQVAALACRGVFFHPAVWLAHRRLRRERELACDQAMGGHLAARRLRYAECLMRLAKWWFLADRYSAEAIGVSSTASFLATRVRILLEEPRRHSQWQILLRAGAVSVIALTGAYGVLSSGLTFYRVDGRQVDPPAQVHTTLSHAQRLPSVNTRARRSAQLPLAQIEHTSTDTDHRRLLVHTLTPTAELDRAEPSWDSQLNDPGLQGESKPTWNEGSIEISPLSRASWASAADTATKVAIGIALASEEEDFRGDH